MARSFLFAPDNGDVATTRLISTAAQFTGFMKGEPGGERPGWYVPGRDNSAFLGALHASLAAAFPQAGPALWAVRMWTNLLWQPAYLSVIAVHIHGAVPDLRGLSQNRRTIYVDGYRLRPGPLWSGSPETMIERAGAFLRPWTGQLLLEVNAWEKLRPLPAQRLLADRILSLLVLLAQKRPELSREAIEAHAQAWLAVLGLEGQGSLQWLPLEDGRTVPIVSRKGCCLDYLATPPRFCANCPRQDRNVRLSRQLAEWGVDQSNTSSG